MAREQRRLAAIMAVDVVGYSRLMGRDESGTLERLREHRKLRFDPALAHHDGRLVKLTGDGALAEFPSAVNALAAAIEFQQSMAEANREQPDDTAMLFRIGLHLGDLIVEGDDLYGDGVNVAARLEAEAPPGGIVISGNLHDAVIGRLKATFHDLGELALRNIERPVRAYRVQGEGGAGASATVSPQVRSITQDRPSIAVLPFQNMSGDPEQEYFADGMVEEIITALARFPMLFVIARNSSFTYKGRTVDIKQVGRELGVRYVLEGSVRKAGGRVRITGQLIEVASGTHLWADKFDGELNDVFDLQDRVATSVVSVVAPKIRQSELERTRTKPTESLDSYDCFLRGMAAATQPAKWPTSESYDWFKRACELDPGFATAQLMLAKSLQMRQSATGVLLNAEERAEVLRLAEYTCQLAGADPFVLAGAAHLFAYIGHNYDRAETMIEQAIALNPNDSSAWANRGWIAVMCGEHERAIESFERQMQLSPLTPGRSVMLCGLAFVHYQAGTYDQGRDIAAKSVELNPDVHALCALIVNEVALGRLEEAHASARRLLLVQPDFIATKAHWMFPMRSPETRDRIVAALRASGIPD